MSNKPTSTKRAGGQNQHVVPEQGRWAVRAAGERGAVKLYDTQAEAIAAAKQAARKTAAVVIHARDGRVRQTISRSRADELMLRAWKSVHAESSDSEARRAG